MRIYTMLTGLMETNCYLVVTKERHIAVIDPGADPETIIAKLEDLGSEPSMILLTHAHYDHNALHRVVSHMVLDRMSGQWQLSDLRITGIADPADMLQHIYENVRDAAYSIIESKGATYYGIGMAVRRIAEAIVRDEHSVLPVTSLIQGHYGVDGICLGLPSIVGRNGVEAVLDIPLSADELARLQGSAQKMKALIAELH